MSLNILEFILSRVTRSYRLTTFEVAREPKIPRGTCLYSGVVWQVVDTEHERDRELTDMRIWEWGKRKKINVSTSWTWNFGFGTHGFTWFDAWSVMSNLRSFFTTCIPCWITNPNRIHAIHKYIIYITRCTCLKNKNKKSIK